MDQQTPADQTTHPAPDADSALDALAAIDRLSLILLRRESQSTQVIRGNLNTIATAFGFEIVEEEDPWDEGDEDDAPLPCTKARPRKLAPAPCAATSPRP